MSQSELSRILFGQLLKTVWTSQTVRFEKICLQSERSQNIRLQKESDLNQICVQSERNLSDGVFSPRRQARVRKFGPKILQLLTEWTETFPTDFREEKMIGHLKDIIHRIAPCDEVK